MKLYTKTGDKGYSSLYNGISLKKSSIYFKLLGDLDELNCHIGMSKSLWKDIIDKPDKVYNIIVNYNILTHIQCMIMDISSFIATPPWHENKPIKGNVEDCIHSWIEKVGFDEQKISEIEKYIDYLDSLTPSIKNFVVPGNNTLVSSIHICRTVTRRCERSYIKFLNSDLIYYGV